ncbi:MAG: hypothetical protein KME47_10160 [Nodosilinea sp. WJT8-NPBG4]|jgi:hypothetical protein|nr:hypothetical protein [Nodosilinea sp. WJT8-NPBG4]
MNPFEESIVNLIYLNWESKTPPTVEECKSFVKPRLKDLMGASQIIDSLPAYVCRTDLLESAIAYAVSSINWANVYFEAHKKLSNLRHGVFH